VGLGEGKAVVIREAGGRDESLENLPRIQSICHRQFFVHLNFHAESIAIESIALIELIGWIELIELTLIRS